MRELKNTKGITLIALVLTIIILIILAGVSISLVLGDNGLVDISKRSAMNYTNSAGEEQVKINELLNMINGGYVDKEASDPIIYSITYNGNGGSGEMTPTTGQNPVVVANTFAAPSGKLFKEWNTSADGNGTPYAVGTEINSNITLYAIWDLSSKYPYIPNGFSHTEGEWNNGYTIMNDTTYDEFVWVPCTMTATSETVAFAKVFPKKDINASDFTSDPNYMYNKNKLTDYADYGDTPAAIRSSVGKYGGFYIAKYEASSSDGTSSGTARSLSNKTPWTYITRTDAIAKSEAMVNTSDNVKSAMISGECWDTTLQWMVSTGNSGFDTNSTNRGWFSNNSGNALKNTGLSINTSSEVPPNRINNIWDIAGNANEWTTENCKNSQNVVQGVNRGGTYYRQGSTDPAAYRGGYDNTGRAHLTFRVVLYKQVIE